MMSARRFLWGVAAIVVATLAGGCGGEDGSVQTPPLPPLAKGQVDPGPPSAVKASSTPSRRIEMPGPRSAVNASMQAEPAKKRGGSR